MLALSSSMEGLCCSAAYTGTVSAKSITKDSSNAEMRFFIPLLLFIRVVVFYAPLQGLYAMFPT